MIGLIQAEGLVGILLAPLHKLVAVEAVVIPVALLPKSMQLEWN